MSLAVAIPCALGASVAYGISTAGQHSAAHTGTGRADARGLINLLRHPLWLAAMAGDGIGLILHVIALATGPVVLVAPLLVLSIPVSLPAGRAFGGPRPQPMDYLACLAIIGGLAAFFALLGNPGEGRRMTVHAGLITIVVTLVAAAVLAAAVRGRSPTVRAAGYGLAAGGCFGVVGVLVNATADAWRDHGMHAFTHTVGLVPLAGTLLLGAFGLALIQIAFQVGRLSASFPASEAAAPVVSVILGGVLLHENVPISWAILVGYLLCLAAVSAGAIRLARG